MATSLRRARTSLSVLQAFVFFVLAAAPRAHAAAPVASDYQFVPDPASVERFGPAYRYPQAGWIVLHIEGEPYDRGYQHGRLLAPEIAAYVKAMATTRSPKAPADAWHSVRMTVDALFLRRFEKEYLEEMKGIADGAAAAGAKFDGRAIDLVDIAAVNSDMELICLESALHATPTGLEGKPFQEPTYSRPATPAPEHCSAFAAVGPATADGKVVIGHITMFSLYMAYHYNVWLDVQPAKGHRVLMQTYPGGIQSGMDYYMNDNGLVVAETTLAQTNFDINGRSLASRIRRALQYADNIDQACDYLREGNNGLYTNEWLLADTKANEIAMFELGTHKTKLWRSGKKQWLAGAEGFYWGCNNAKDLEVRLETVPGTEGRPANVVFHPSDRDKTWLALYEANKGKIGPGFGFEAFTTAPLSAFPSLDAKFTTTAMAGELKTFAIFGPPLGRVWDPLPSDLARLPDTHTLVPNDWTVLRAGAPEASSSASEAPVAVDLPHGKAAARGRDGGGREEDGSTAPDLSLRSRTNNEPAWRGTLLPGDDRDLWLAAAFADYERVVSLDKSLKAHAKDGKLSESDRERIDVALFAARSQYLTAVRRLEADTPLAAIKPDWTRDEWYQIAAGKGVLLLDALRERMGEKPFEKLMIEFGKAHAGKPATSKAFHEAATRIHGMPLNTFFDIWLNGTGMHDDKGGGIWSIDSYQAEPQKALIVYGTLKDKAAQREAAERLQRAIERHWSNVTVPIKADTEITPDDFLQHHLLLVGRPETNSISARCAPDLPVKFGPGSFTVRGKTYAHPKSAIIVACENTTAPRYSIVVFAGLSAEATWECVTQPNARGGAAAEALVMPAAGRAVRLALPAEARKGPVALRAKAKP